jgi:hypothetical protein
MANSNRLSDDDGAAIPSTTGANHAGCTDYGVGFTGFDSHRGGESCNPECRD